MLVSKVCSNYTSKEVVSSQQQENALNLLSMLNDGCLGLENAVEVVGYHFQTLLHCFKSSNTLTVTFGVVIDDFLGECGVCVLG